jgi:hypothetical protein
VCPCWVVPDHQAPTGRAAAPAMAAAGSGCLCGRDAEAVTLTDLLPFLVADGAHRLGQLLNTGCSGASYLLGCGTVQLTFGLTPM